MSDSIEPNGTKLLMLPPVNQGRGKLCQVEVNLFRDSEALSSVSRLPNSLALTGTSHSKASQQSVRVVKLHGWFG